MCLSASQWLSINSKTGIDPLKCPEVTPITENLSLSLDTHMKRHLIQTATLRFICFPFLFIIPSLEKVCDKFYALEVGRKSEKWQSNVVA